MKAIARRPRVFQFDGVCSGFVPEGLENWPASMQDEVYQAMENLLASHGIRELEVIQAVCYQDTKGPIWQTRIVVMEKLGPEDVRIIH